VDIKWYQEVMATAVSRSEGIALECDSPQEAAKLRFAFYRARHLHKLMPIYEKYRKLRFAIRGDTLMIADIFFEIDPDGNIKEPEKLRALKLNELLSM